MKSLLLDLINTPAQTKSYPLMGNINRISQYNIDKQFRFILSMPYNQENQNVLVGLLQNLSIDPEWELDYVVAYSRLRSGSLCSAFNVNSQSKNATATKNVVYYNGCDETLCLLETDKVYDPAVTYSDLKPLVPLYTSFALYTYNPPVERYKQEQLNLKDQYAILGLNIVELAIGWWLFMKDPAFEGLGIHAYIAKVVTPRFGILSNELSLFNGVCDYYVNQSNSTDLLLTESVVFNTMSYMDGISKYVSYMIDALKNAPLKSHLHLYPYFEGRLIPHLSFLFNTDVYKGKYYENVIWCLEASAIKYLSLYFAIINDQGKKSDGERSMCLQTIPLITNRYNHIKNVALREHLLKQLDQLFNLAKIN